MERVEDGPNPNYGIVANVVTDRVLRKGAKVWIHFWHGSFDSAMVSGISKGGRVIEKYVKFSHLTNYRAAWIPQHMRDRVGHVFTKERATESAKAIMAAHCKVSC